MAYLDHNSGTNFTPMYIEFVDGNQAATLPPGAMPTAFASACSS